MHYIIKHPAGKNKDNIILTPTLSVKQIFQKSRKFENPSNQNQINQLTNRKLL